MKVDKKIEIFCDMDGVLCDFVGHAAPLFGETYESLLKKASPGKYWIFEEALGIKHEDFWKVANVKGSDFWLSMPAYSWAKELYSELCKRGEVYILSAPAPSKFCSAAKQEWINTFMGVDHFDKFIPTKHKHLLAKPHRMLIDDCDENCKTFADEGGGYVIFPQHWNSSFYLKEDPVASTLKTLDILLDQRPIRYGL